MSGRTRRLTVAVTAATFKAPNISEMSHGHRELPHFSYPKDALAGSPQDNPEAVCPRDASVLFVWEMEVSMER